MPEWSSPPARHHYHAGISCPSNPAVLTWTHLSCCVPGSSALVHHCHRFSCLKFPLIHLLCCCLPTGAPQHRPLASPGWELSPQSSMPTNQSLSSWVHSWLSAWETPTSTVIDLESRFMVNLIARKNKTKQKSLHHYLYLPFQEPLISSWNTSQQVRVLSSIFWLHFAHSNFPKCTILPWLRIFFPLVSYSTPASSPPHP